jgi:hypothetical protein
LPAENDGEDREKRDGDNERQQPEKTQELGVEALKPFLKVLKEDGIEVGGAAFRGRRGDGPAEQHFIEEILPNESSSHVPGGCSRTPPVHPRKAFAA